MVRRERLAAGELGLGARWWPGAIVGLVLAAAAALVAVFVLQHPPIVGAPVAYASVRGMPPERLLANVLVFLPLGTAIPEELAFRGVLLGLLRRRRGELGAIVLSSLAFALWHAVVVVLTVARTNVATTPLTYALGLAVAFLVVFTGGCALAVLRLGTRHLAAPVAAHWGFVGALLLALRYAI